MADIRSWVEANPGILGEPSARPARLERTLKTLVLGKPIHSQLAERVVGVGVGQQTKHAPHESPERFSGKVVAECHARLDASVAAYEYEEEHKKEIEFENRRSAPAIHWRDQQTGQVRAQRPPPKAHINKDVMVKSVLAFQRRAAQVTPAVAEAAVAAAAARKKAGTDTAGRQKRSAEAEAAAAQVRADKRKAKKAAITSTSCAQAAKQLNPKRVELGRIDLAKPPRKEVLAQECELRGLAVKRDAKGQPNELVKFLVKRLRDHNAGKDLIDQLTPFESLKTQSVEWKSGPSPAWTQASRAPYDTPVPFAEANSASCASPLASLPPAPAAGASAFSSTSAVCNAADAI